MKTKSEIQKEANDALINVKRGGVNISMGVGKTLIGLNDMNSLYTVFSKYLVVAPKKSIYTSWNDEAVKWNIKHLLESIDYCTYRSLHKQGFDYDVVYLDECHSLTETCEEWLNEYLSKGGRVIGLTGTYPAVDYSTKGKLCNKFCPLVYNYDVDEAVSDNILNDYRIRVHLIPLGTNKTLKKEGKYGTFHISEKKDYEYWESRLEDAKTDKQKMMLRIQRMKAMQVYPSKEAYAKKLIKLHDEKLIVFANTQKQADELCEHRYHSNNDKSEESLELFKKGEVLKLSCVDQISEGVTIPNLGRGIIMHAYSNNRKSSQRIGRMMRLDPENTAYIEVLCYLDTVDVTWVQDALSKYDSSKIQWLNTI